jgi:hypothetical protein
MMVDSSEMKHFKRHIFSSRDGQQTFYLSIIDFLQEWNKVKRGEYVVKTTVSRAQASELSSIEPDLYMRRFQLFLRNQVILPEPPSKQFKRSCLF